MDSNPTRSAACAIATMSAQRGVRPSIEPSTYGRLSPSWIRGGAVAVMWFEPASLRGC